MNTINNITTNNKNAEQKEVYVGVAIVCWNNEAILPQCLTSVHEQSYKNIKTIVLDNNSSDRSTEIIEHDYPWVDLIKSPTNTGFAKGNNIAIAELLKDKLIDYFVLLNSDANLGSRWVEKLVDFAQKTKKVALMQGLTLDYFDHNTIDSTHIFINKNGQAIQSGYRQSVGYAASSVRKVFGVNAAACMVTRNYLEDQPFDYLFDEDFFMYLEDVDIAARSLVLGWNNYFIPEAIAYHMGSASSGKSPGFSVYMVNRNIWPVILKNLPAIIIIMIIPRMIVADIRELYRIGRGKNFRVMKMFVLGRIKGFFIALHYIKSRKTISKGRKINRQALWRFMADGVQDR